MDPYIDRVTSKLSPRLREIFVAAAEKISSPPPVDGQSASEIRGYMRRNRRSFVAARAIYENRRIVVETLERDYQELERRLALIDEYSGAPVPGGVDPRTIQRATQLCETVSNKAFLVTQLETSIGEAAGRARFLSSIGNAEDAKRETRSEEKKARRLSVLREEIAVLESQIESLLSVASTTTNVVPIRAAGDPG